MFRLGKEDTRRGAERDGIFELKRLGDLWYRERSIAEKNEEKAAALEFSDCQVGERLSRQLCFHDGQGGDRGGLGTQNRVAQRSRDPAGVLEEGLLLIRPPAFGANRQDDL